MLRTWQMCIHIYIYYCTLSVHYCQSQVFCCLGFGLTSLITDAFSRTLAVHSSTAPQLLGRTSFRGLIRISQSTCQYGKLRTKVSLASQRILRHVKLPYSCTLCKTAIVVITFMVVLGSSSGSGSRVGLGMWRFGWRTHSFGLGGSGACP